MAITQQELGRRIRAAREACRMTQEQVAQQLGLSRPTVVQIEAGNRSVSSLELDKLAYLFARDIRELVAESFEAEDALAALFRAQPEVIEDPAVLDKLRECLALGREITNLERLVGIDRDLAAVAAYSLPAPRNRWEAIQQGQRLAEEERRRLGLGSGPLPSLSELLEIQGVRTGLVDLPDDISGLTLSDRKVGLFVVANRAHHYLRRRFSFAHEYAHVIADRERFGFVSRASERDDLVEVRANAFAASFLMPEDGVRQFVAGLGKGKPSRSYAEVFDEAGSLDVEGRTEPGSQAVQLYDVVQLAHYFGVSRPSALFRLRNLRLVSEAELEHLRALDDVGKGKKMAELLGLPEPDHTEIRNEFRHRFLGLALEAYRREEISRGKLKELAAMVDLPAAELDKLIDDAGFDDHDTPPVHMP
ncbi:MAG TPA: XRE family transcriptional regulator [Thermoanaerobaculia bacterium]|jgi:Zn-dependent peptidase ImmA (M78 family)/transcriptional regulator with XRE-family HTH domain